MQSFTSRHCDNCKNNISNVASFEIRVLNHEELLVKVLMTLATIYQGPLVSRSLISNKGVLKVVVIGCKKVNKAIK
jgi:hypothetical protein